VLVSVRSERDCSPPWPSLRDASSPAGRSVFCPERPDEVWATPSLGAASNTG
jgi:hypothetical protein